jgi:hypothetical protein
MFHTIKYKTGYIHITYLNKKEKITAQVVNDKTGLCFIKDLKSFRAAQLFITKFMKK